MKHILTIPLLLACLAMPAASAGASFDFDSIQALYVIQDDKGHAYGQFPVFRTFRDLISEKMKAAVRETATGAATFEIRVVGIGEETTIYVGDHWIADGERTATLSDDEMAWIHWAYDLHRDDEGLDRAMVETLVGSALKEQQDPAWRPAP